MLPVLALFIVGPVITLPLAALRGVDAGHDVSLLVGANPLLGILLGGTLLLAAAVYGWLSARLIDARTGTLSAGFLLAWAAWRTGSMEWLFRLQPGSGTLIRLSVESTILGVGALVICLLIVGSGRGRHENPHADLPGPHLGSLKQLANPQVLAGVGVGALAALVIAHLVAFNPLRGQALVAAVLASIAAGALTRLVIGAAANREAPSASPYAAVALAGIVGPVIGFITPGAARLDDAALHGTLLGPLLVQPLDWAAGMLIGTPIGLAWAGAAVHKAHDVESASSR
ncbi:MAG: hypothetical protein DYG94_13455 [Leptolyngbya sp. PLA3]|nr:MAG: hypothetical protein EDM82_14010 [Cyanobacteria bacterium CYA]MCE7969732.1 hypothetical protein [Leptolyngbya sp. PL-A3]